MCVLILLYVCPHTPVTPICYSYMCVLILLHVCPHTTMCVLMLLCVSSYSYMCVLMLLLLLYVCPHTTTYVLILQRLAEKEEMELHAARERIASLKKGNARHLEQMRRQACLTPPAYAVHTVYSSSSTCCDTACRFTSSSNTLHTHPSCALCSTHSIQ